jgi:MarR family transcriptional regulator, lower aerobic nicotinate degradation pathway regulator
MSAPTTAKQPPAAEPAPRIVDGREQLPFGVLLARLGQESMARFRKALRPLEVTAQQYVVLKQLQAFGTASQATLADALGLDYSNLATVTGELSDAGLIERYRHESDRRRYVIELSERGSELVARCDKELYEGEQEMLGSLSDSDRERFWILLREVADNANLCPGTPAENAAACAGEEPPGSA